MGCYGSFAQRVRAVNKIQRVNILINITKKGLSRNIKHRFLKTDELRRFSIALAVLAVTVLALCLLKT